jgi:probable rRNA maturation factor
MIGVLIDESISERAVGLDPTRIQRAAEVALTVNKLTAKDHTLTIVITNDEEITALNRQYRQIDSATDVLSFTANERDPSSGLIYLGDVVISYERACENLKDRLGKWQAADVERELLLLTVHGVLHLLDFDHAGPEEKARMWVQQDLILKELGYGG